MLINDPNLTSLYFSSADNYIRTLTNSLLELEKQGDGLSFINEAFRAAHSMKGESLTMGFEKIGNLCHEMEEIFRIFQESTGKQTINSETITKLLEATDALKENVKEVKAGREEHDTTHLIEELKQAEAALKKGEEGFGVKSKTISKTELAKLETTTFSLVDSINVKTQILDNLMNIMEEFIILKLRFDKALEEQSLEKIRDFKKRMELLLSEFQYYISQARLIPIGEVFENFPRLVRDIARVQGKNIDLKLNGTDLRIDRTIADRLIEPLTHLLRNAIDHGIETPETRKRLKKPPLGKIQLSAHRDKDRGIVEITDDGSGFDFEKIKKAALKNAKIDVNTEGTVDKNSLIDLLYQGGISTSATVTSYSGRGMGLYAVRSTMELLGGSFWLETEPNKGTHFVLEFPLTLAIIKALLVKIGKETFAIPTANIIQSLRYSLRDIKRVADQMTIVLGEEEVGIIDLDSEFFQQMPVEGRKAFPIVVIQQESKKLGLLVNSILGLAELTVKPLAQFPTISKDFSGATVLGDGRVALIIDINILFNKF